jgi:uncharacterized protein involved in response to NO
MPRRNRFGNGDGNCVLYWIIGLVLVCLFLSIIIASVVRFFTTKKVTYKEDSYFNSITVDHRV